MVPSTLVQLLLCASALEVLLIALRLQGDLRYRIPEAIGLLLLASAIYFTSVYLILRPKSTAKSRSDRRLPLVILGAAIVFRLTVWPMAPALSDDVFRYRWEGMLQAHGGNPYQTTPDQEEWTHLRDETFPRVGSKDVRSGYGPLLELMERWTYQVVSTAVENPTRQAFWYKAPSALFDLGIIAALWLLLAAHGLPAARVLIYAWSPLPLIEFWGNGHNDAAAVFFVVLALTLAARRKWTLSFAALSLAACAKIWPLLLFPIFIGWKGGRPQRWFQWLALLPIAGLLAWPYWSNIERNVRHMSGFVGGWRNNDSLYGLLLWLTGDQYPAKYAAFAIIIGTAAVITLRRWPLERASLAAIAVMLMFSANCHPWYLTWMIPLLAFSPVPALLLWTALAPLAYRVVIAWALLAEWEGSTDWRWLIYGPVYALLAGTWLISRKRRRAAVRSSG